MPEVLNYEPNVDRRLITYTRADETRINLKSPRPWWGMLLVLGADVALLIILIDKWNKIGMERSAGTFLLLAFVTAFGVAAYIDDRTGRATLRVHPGGFDYVKATIFGRTDLSVAWHEVGRIADKRGVRLATFRVRHHLLIELLNHDPEEIVPLELMSGRRPADIELVRSHLERWRQSAADASPTPEYHRQHMDPFLQAAIDEAKLGLSEGGLPIGSVLVRGGQIIGRGHNRRVQQGDPMAHAEIDCLKNAGRQASYKDTVLYSTLMPCFLCTGAAVQFGVPKVVVGESVTFPGGDSKWGRSGDFMRASGIEVVDLHDDTCIAMMTDFIKNNPTLWNEDIGV